MGLSLIRAQNRPKKLFRQASKVGHFLWPHGTHWISTSRWPKRAQAQRRRRQLACFPTRDPCLQAPACCFHARPGNRRCSSSAGPCYSTCGLARRPMLELSSHPAALEPYKTPGCLPPRFPFPGAHARHQQLPCKSPCVVEDSLQRPAHLRIC